MLQRERNGSFRPIPEPSERGTAGARRSASRKLHWAAEFSAPQTGWRLLLRLDSLCAKARGGKYYPNGNFLSATKRRWSSETWRSILYGRGVLTKGLINRVGPGEFSIWWENWIPGLHSLKPLVRQPTADVELVCHLFIPGTREWDEEVVRNSFMALEATEILKIKPSTMLAEDVRAWAFEKNGLYSVRSAYMVLKDEQTAMAMAKSDEARGSGDDRACNLISKLKVPP
ncbi:hypothetical protein C2845_PM18G02140 [Panicum miliaceum]|uniref:Uncharacterized protein n=1 Tax=Panicum miliaceum TaxID=4540 RepID=A0A3L6PIK5_PANMI|nr:hypothetical protein C2845_PM18G02140 [Panicum miliaceum]